MGKNRFIQCCPLVKGKHSTQSKAKGHRGLPENPVELREAFTFPNKLCNWIQVEHYPAARRSVYANEKTQFPRTVAMPSWVIFSLLPKWENRHLGLDSHSAQGWYTPWCILFQRSAIFSSFPTLTSSLPCGRMGDRWGDNLGLHSQEETDKHGKHLLWPRRVSSH